MTFSTDDNTPQEPVKQPTAPAPATFKDDEQVSLEQFQEAARAKYGIPKNLMKAMLQQESQEGKDLTSPTGVSGPWQVTEAVAKQYGLDRNDPFHNVAAGARYLKEQYDALGDIKDENERWLGAVGRYYGGPSAVQGGIADRVSRDGLSNPVEHLERVAKNWRELGLDGVPQGNPALAPAPEAPPQKIDLSEDDPYVLKIERGGQGTAPTPRTNANLFGGKAEITGAEKGAVSVDPRAASSFKVSPRFTQQEQEQYFNATPEGRRRMAYAAYANTQGPDRDSILQALDRLSSYEPEMDDLSRYESSIPHSEFQVGSRVPRLAAALRAGGPQAFDREYQNIKAERQQFAAEQEAKRQEEQQAISSMKQRQFAPDGGAGDAALDIASSQFESKLRGIAGGAAGLLSGITEELGLEGLDRSLVEFSDRQERMNRAIEAEQEQAQSRTGLSDYTAAGARFAGSLPVAAGSAMAGPGGVFATSLAESARQQPLKAIASSYVNALLVGGASGSLRQEGLRGLMAVGGAEGAVNALTTVPEFAELYNARSRARNPQELALINKQLRKLAADAVVGTAAAGLMAGGHKLSANIGKGRAPEVNTPLDAYSTLPDNIKAEIYAAEAAGEQHPVITDLIWKKTLDRASVEGIHADAIRQAVEAQDAISQKRAMMGGLPVNPSPVLQAQYQRVLELNALNHAQYMVEGLPSLGIPDAGTPAVNRQITPLASYTDRMAQAIQEVAPDFPVDLSQPGATIRTKEATGLGERLMDSTDPDAIELGIKLRFRAAQAEKQGLDSVGLFNVEAPEAVATAVHEQLHPQQSKLIERNIRTKAADEAKMTLSDIELSERIAKQHGTQRADTIQESIANRVGNVRYTSSEPARTVTVQGESFQQDRPIYDTSVRDTTLGNLLGGGRYASELQSRFRKAMEADGYFQDPNTKDIEQVYEPLAKLTDRDFLRRSNINPKEAEALVISELRALNVDSEAVRSLADHLPASQRRAFLEFLDNRGTDKYKGTVNETKATAKVKSNPPSEASANPAPTGRGSDEKPLPVDLAPKDGAGEAGRPAPTETGARNEPTSQEGTPTTELEAQRTPATEPRTEPEQRQPGKQKGSVAFKTSKGSLYESHEDGTTTRNKSYHPEHGEKDQGIQPRSEQTFYVDRKGLEALGLVQTRGGGKLAIERRGGQAAVRYLEGENAGKYAKTSLTEVSDTPEVGKYPVELWEGGTKVHFGNEIVDVISAEKPATSSAIRSKSAPDATTASATTRPAKESTVTPDFDLARKVRQEAGTKEVFPVTDAFLKEREQLDKSKTTHTQPSLLPEGAARATTTTVDSGVRRALEHVERLHKLGRPMSASMQEFLKGAGVDVEEFQRQLRGEIKPVAEKNSQPLPTPRVQSENATTALETPRTAGKVPATLLPEINNLRSQFRAGKIKPGEVIELSNGVKVKAPSKDSQFLDIVGRKLTEEGEAYGRSAQRIRAYWANKTGEGEQAVRSILDTFNLPGDPHTGEAQDLAHRAIIKMYDNPRMAPETIGRLVQEEAKAGQKLEKTGSSLAQIPASDLYARLKAKGLENSLPPDLRQIGKEVAQGRRGQISLYNRRLKEASEEASASTQRAITTGSYKKITEDIKRVAPGAKSVLDYGAGLGLGTDALREGLPSHKVDAFEPFPGKWKGKTAPTYTDSGDINTKYDVVTSANVLNVLRRPLRDEVVKDIYDKIAPGGTGIIITRGWNGDISPQKGALGAEPKSKITSDGVYQKGWDGNELVEYLKEVVPGAKIEKYTGAGKNGAIIRKPEEGSVLYNRKAGQKDESGFYSQLEKTIDQKFGKTVSLPEMERALRNSKEVKADELKWSGFDDFLVGKQMQGISKVPKEEVLRYLQANSAKLKVKEKWVNAKLSPEMEERITSLKKESDELKSVIYSLAEAKEKLKKEYRKIKFLEGMEDRKIEMREKINSVYADLFRVFSKQDDINREVRSLSKYETTKYEDYATPGGDPDFYKEVLLTLNDPYRREESNFSSPHWDEQNVLSHARIDDRVDVDGNSVRHVHEIQSDWMQAARKHGVEDFSSLKKIFQKKQLEELHEKWQAGFAEDGFNLRRGVDPREHEALWERLYTLVKEYRGWNSPKVPDAPLQKTWHETTFRKLVQQAAEDGKARLTWDTGETNSMRYPGAQSMNSNYKAGMHSFYDRVLPEYAKKFARKWGAKVGTTEVPVRDSDPDFDSALYGRYLEVHKTEDGKITLYDGRGADPLYFSNEQSLYKHLEKKEGIAPPDKAPQKVHFIEINDAMRESVTKEGVALYNRKQQETPEFKKWFGNSDAVDSKGKPVMVYHGTTTNVPIYSIEMSKMNPDSLYGPGFYMTQSKEVAGGDNGYVSKRSKLSDADRNLYNSVQIDNIKKVALESGMHVEFPESQDVMDITNAIYRKTKDILKSNEVLDKALELTNKWWDENYDINRPHVYPMYTNIKNAFNIDNPIPKKQYKILRKSINEWLGESAYKIDFDKQNTALETGHDLYRALEKYLSKEEINTMLKEAGYGGITHIGGGRFGGGRAESNIKTFSSETEAAAYADEVGGKLNDKTVQGHRVWISFEPNQVKSAIGNAGTFSDSNNSILYNRTPKSSTDKSIEHPSDSLNGKKMIGRTGDGRAIVRNPENKTGVSVVKDRSFREADSWDTSVPLYNRARLNPKEHIQARVAALYSDKNYDKIPIEEKNKVKRAFAEAQTAWNRGNSKEFAEKLIQAQYYEDQIIGSKRGKVDKTLDAVTTGLRVGILTNPASRVADVTGTNLNAQMQFGINPLRRLIAHVADATLAKSAAKKVSADAGVKFNINPNEKLSKVVPKLKGKDWMSGTANGFTEGAKEFAEQLVKGYSSLQMESGMSYNVDRLQTGWKYIDKPINRVAAIFGNAPDSFARGIVFDTVSRQLARQHAEQFPEAQQKAEFDKFYQDMPQEAIGLAVAMTERYTYNNPNRASELVHNIIDNFVAEPIRPSARALANSTFKFVKVPTNVAAQGMRLAAGPAMLAYDVGMLYHSLLQSYNTSTGKFDMTAAERRRSIDNLTESAVGSMLFAGLAVGTMIAKDNAYNQAIKKNVAGSYDESDTEATKMEEVREMEPGAVTVKGRTFRPGTFGPLQRTAQFQKDFLRGTGYQGLDQKTGKLKEAGASDIYAPKTGSLSKAVISQMEQFPLVGGAVETAKFLDPAKGDMAKSVANTITPGIAREIGSYTDENRRVPRKGSLWDNLKNNFGAGNDMPARINAAGEPVTKRSGASIWTKKYPESKGLDEVERLGLPLPRHNVSEKDSKYTMKEQEGKAVFLGQTIKAATDKVVTSTAYQKAKSDEEKAQMLNDVIQGINKSPDLTADEALHNAKIAVSYYSGREKLRNNATFQKLAPSQREAAENYLKAQYNKYAVTNELKVDGEKPDLMSLGADFFDFASDKAALSDLIQESVFRSAEKPKLPFERKKK